MSARNIERLFNVVNQNLATTNGTLEYNRVTDAIIRLCEELLETDTDQSTWGIGEGGEFCLSDLIVGAYFHYSDWDGRQSPSEYLALCKHIALCKLSAIYSPNLAWEPMQDTSEETAYELLNQMAELCHGEYL